MQKVNKLTREISKSASLNRAHKIEALPSNDIRPKILWNIDHIEGYKNILVFDRSLKFHSKVSQRFQTPNIDSHADKRSYRFKFTHQTSRSYSHHRCKYLSTVFRYFHSAYLVNIVFCCGKKSDYFKLNCDLIANWQSGYTVGIAMEYTIFVSLSTMRYCCYVWSIRHHHPLKLGK